MTIVEVAIQSHRHHSSLLHERATPTSPWTRRPPTKPSPPQQMLETIPIHAKQLTTHAIGQTAPTLVKNTAGEKSRARADQAPQPAIHLMSSSPPRPLHGSSDFTTMQQDTGNLPNTSKKNPTIKTLQVSSSARHCHRYQTSHHVNRSRAAAPASPHQSKKPLTSTTEPTPE